jgi:hypothetical protein
MMFALEGGRKRSLAEWEAKVANSVSISRHLACIGVCKLGQASS